jgi:hypothetical protein
MGEMPWWLLVVMVCLATHRVTRFITTDAFPLVAGPRRWIDRNWNPFPAQATWDSYRSAPQAAKDIVIQNLREQQGITSRPTGFKRSVAYLIGCSWCTSIWVSAGLTSIVAWQMHISWLYAMLLWLTSSSVTGLISQREPE